MAVTSQQSAYSRVGEIMVTDWKVAGLLKASTVKPILATVERSLITRTLGKLREPDLTRLREGLRVILG
jgi:hypothetical protein